MNKNNIFSIIFTFDILFMPFLISIPLSCALWPIWFFQNLRDVNTKIMIPVLLLVFLVIFSFFYNININSINEKIFINSFNNTGILIYMSLLLVLMNSTIHDSKVIMYNLLITYVIFSLILSLLFLVDPQLYFGLRSYWTASGNEIIVEYVSTLTRFTGILSDPNNMAVSICAITSLLLNIKPDKSVRALTLLLANAIIIISTMSATGFISYALLLLYFAFFCKLDGNKELNMVKKFLIFILAATSFTVLIILIKDNILFQLSFERVMESDANSRFSRWSTIFDSQNFLQKILIGDGGVILINSGEYKPHNGHFHILFGFGIIPYLLFLILFCKFSLQTKLVNNIYLLILIFGFTVNVGIYEPRFAGIWVILISLFHAHFSNSSKRINHVPGKNRKRRSMRLSKV